MGRTKIGDYIDTGIEDYVVKKNNQGYGMGVRINLLEMLVLFLIALLTILMVSQTLDIDRISETLSGWTQPWVMLALFWELIKGLFVPFVFAILIAFVYSIANLLLDKLFGYSLDDITKNKLEDTSKELGYKLKMLEELGINLYRGVEKRQYPDGDEETSRSVNNLFEELVTKLNTEVELDNGYVTRKYEIITIDKTGVYYTTSFKDLSYKGFTQEITSVPTLMTRTAIDWYNKLTTLNSSLYELKTLEEIYRTQKESEENRLNLIKTISEKRKQEEEIKNAKLKNDSLRESVLPLLGTTTVIRDLEDEIEKVNTDSKEVITEGLNLLK